MKAALFVLCPGKVASGERFAGEECESLLEPGELFLRLVAVAEFGEEALELLEVDADVAAVELVVVAVAGEDGLAEVVAGIGRGAPEPVASLLGWLIGPERVDDLVAVRAVGMEGQIRQELAGGAAEAATVLARAGNRERAKH